MSSVFLARDPFLSRLVAVKVLHPDLLFQEAVLARFFKEAKTVSRIRPHVVSIFDFGIEDKAPYLVLEFIDGQTVQKVMDQLRGEPMDPIVACAMMAQIVEGLGAASEWGVVHRDLKPENLMLTQKGQVKITDFGICHLKGHTMTVTGQMLGSPRFMSPEQVDGIKPLSIQSDLFSLGGVFYYLLAGVPPFQGDTLPDLYRQIFIRTPSFPVRGSARIGQGFDATGGCAFGKGSCKARSGTLRGFDISQEIFVEKESDLPGGPDRRLRARTGRGGISNHVQPESGFGPAMDGKRGVGGAPDPIFKAIEKSRCRHIHPGFELGGWPGLPPVPTAGKNPFETRVLRHRNPQKRPFDAPPTPASMEDQQHMTLSLGTRSRWMPESIPSADTLAESWTSNPDVPDIQGTEHGRMADHPIRTALRGNIPGWKPLRPNSNGEKAYSSREISVDPETQIRGRGGYPGSDPSRDPILEIRSHGKSGIGGFTLSPPCYRVIPATRSLEKKHHPLRRAPNQLPFQMGSPRLSVDRFLESVQKAIVYAIRDSKHSESLGADPGAFIGIYMGVCTRSRSCRFWLQH